MSRKKFTIFFVHGRIETDLRDLASEGYKIESYQTCMEFYYDRKNHQDAGVLIIDLSSVSPSVSDTLQRLHDEGFDLPVILITTKTHYPKAITEVRKWWDQGFHGIEFLCKSSHENTCSAIQRAYDFYHEKPMTVDFEALDANFDRLTIREREVMDLVMDGEASNVIGQKLGISVKTVEAHRSRIHAKMHVDDISVLLRMYLVYSSLLEV